MAFQLLAGLTDDDWRAVIEQQVDPAVLKRLGDFLLQRHRAGASFLPRRRDWYAALNLTPLAEVRAVILGQDPYHGENQAHGLSFSVPGGQPLPPSLRNIFKEQQSDVGIDNRQGNLTPWANQGVLLLNSVLTVEPGKAGSHAQRGWEQITDALIYQLSLRSNHLVFMLWGAYAQKKAAFVDQQRHCVLRAPHPSPLSAHRGWFGCRHFSIANRYLQSHSRPSIDWSTG